MSVRLPPLRPGHGLRLLEGSGEFFPALIEAVEGAQREVWMETYIFDFTGSGAEVADALERAARRGVEVNLVVDGFGTPAIPVERSHRFASAGVRCLVYAPVASLAVLWPGSWRRLHRKLVVVDGHIGFCGGINVLDDWHDPNHGTLPSPRFDFAVRVTGPLVQDIHRTMQQLWQRMRAVRTLDTNALAGSFFPRTRTASPAPPAPAPPAQAPQRMARAALVLRDNLRNRTHIERSYLRAIGRAQHEIIIANAYFVPGRRLRLALVQAARRGVRVVLLLQGRYEYFMQYYAARPIYDALLRAGVEIHEYARSFLHAKVAVVDGRWATVGSSNLDPLSLLLAREANIAVQDVRFAATLRARLTAAITQHGERMDAAQYVLRPWRQRFLEHVALAVMRLALLVQGKTYL